MFLVNAFLLHADERLKVSREKVDIYQRAMKAENVM